jgi:octaprenyl-diphosphate synthase
MPLELNELRAAATDSFDPPRDPSARETRRAGAVELAALYAPIRDDLTIVAQLFDDELRTDIAFVNGFCETVRSYRGKMLRPAMLLLSAKSTGCVATDRHTLAAVVEMVHMATLVHDDVLDEADQRRKRPTIRAVAGNVAAVLLGDFLISHAFHLCASLDSQHASRRIGSTTNTVCEGELLQNHHRGNLALTEREYFRIIESKTGALTSVACELGAWCAGADVHVVEALARFGLAAGSAFQIVDDVLDMLGDPKEVGKSLDRDFNLGKLTLPTIHFLSRAPSQGVAIVRGMLTGERPYTREKLVDLLNETGSIEYAMSVASECVREAIDRLDVLPSSDARDSLRRMAQFIVCRRL